MSSLAPITSKTLFCHPLTKWVTQFQNFHQKRLKFTPHFNVKNKKKNYASNNIIIHIKNNLLEPHIHSGTF